MNASNQVFARNPASALIPSAVFNVSVPEVSSWTILGVFAPIIMNVPTIPVANTVVK